MNKEKPIRVLQVLTIMNLGGAETMIMNYYRHIDKTKVQFDFLLHREDKGYFDDEIESLGGKIHRMPPITPQNYFLYKKRLKKFFSEHPEYKIVHSHLNALSSIILGVAKNENIPCRIAHSHLAVEPSVLKKIFKKNTDIKATIKDSIQSLIRWKVAKVATNYFACGEKAGDWLFGKKNRTKVKVVNNAINASLFKYNRTKSEKIKEEIGITNKKVIGHIGRFNEQKNHFLLIKIFHEIYKKNNNCVLLLIGTGNLEDKVKDKAKRLNIHQNIFFLGLRNDIPNLLQGFDVFLFPSLYEGLPVTLIEAQASGLKIITSSTITKEVDITGLIKFIDLQKPESVWAESVLNNLNYNREDTSNQIKENGYDISENAKKMQIFYLNESCEIYG